jgi:DNA-binding response OmpR family regulator
MLALRDLWRTNEARRPRALVVDDEAEVCRMMGDMLHWLGLDPDGATQSREALTLLETDGAYDLLVADLVMPDMSGWDLVSEARGVHPDLRVLLLTGLPTRSAFARARQAGLPLLPKPFTMRALEAAVRDAIGRADFPTR